jgi:membrane-associated protein
MFDIESLISSGGLLLVVLMVFASTGLFFCFFIPTGAFMFTAGIYAAGNNWSYSIVTTCVFLAVAGVLGNVTGYWFGRTTGPLLYRKKDSRFFRQQHLSTASRFYAKYGWLALTLGLYLPIIRTFAAMVAGIVKLDFRKFMLLTSAGSAVWVTSFVMAGYFIGSRPFLKPWLKYIVLFFVIVVTVPLIIWTVREWKRMRRKTVSGGE